MRTVLFVCTGNTCRSPMAEAIARRQIEEGLLGEDVDVFVASAGVSATEGLPTAREAVETLAGMGIEHDSRSTPLTPQMIEKADLVLCMTEAHAAMARELVADDPDALAKISTLDREGDVEDPIGMGQEVYDRLAKHLARVIPQRLQELLQP